MSCGTNKILVVISTIIFIYICEEMYFERIEFKIKMELPSTCKKLAYYYIHYNGNIYQALNETSYKCSKGNKVFIVKIKEAISKVDYKREFIILQEEFTSIWLKMLCNIVIFAKENGSSLRIENHESEDVIARSLTKITNIITLMNIEQSYNNAEFIGMQIFVFIIPMIAVPLSRFYNYNLLVDLNVEDIYKSIQAQNLTAMLIFASNLGALFIHWIRKQSI